MVPWREAPTVSGIGLTDTRKPFNPQPQTEHSNPVEHIPMTMPSREKMSDSRTMEGLRNITNCRANLISGGLVSYEWEELAAEEKVNCHRRSI